MTNKFKKSRLKRLIVQAEDCLQAVNERLVDKLVESTYFAVGILHINLDGPRLLGRKCFDRIFYRRRLPSLRELAKLADRLDMDLEVRALCGSSKRPVQSFRAAGGFSKAQLQDFLLSLSGQAYPCEFEEEILKKRREMIAWLALGRSRLYWRNLSIIFALCGYTIDIELSAKKRTDEALIQRLDYPL